MKSVFFTYSRFRLKLMDEFLKHLQPDSCVLCP